MRFLDWMVVVKPEEGTREGEEEFGSRHPEFEVLAGPPRECVREPFGFGSVA